jgi:hypothetical protein
MNAARIAPLRDECAQKNGLTWGKRPIEMRKNLRKTGLSYDACTKNVRFGPDRGKIES